MGKDDHKLIRSPTGTLDNPIMVRSAGEEQYAGCTGYPVDSHEVLWLTVRFDCSHDRGLPRGLSQNAHDTPKSVLPPISTDANHTFSPKMTKEHPVERCPECGSVYKMDYVGPEDDGHGHGHDHHGYVEPKTFADFVKPEYTSGY